MLFQVVFLLLCAANGLYADVIFGEMVQMGQVRTPELTDNSGLGASRVHAGIVYGHNDRGDRARLFALNAETGRLVATLRVQGATNVDWEDLSVGPCGQAENASCIYLADIGGHGKTHTIYKIREPDHLNDSIVDVLQALPFTWSESDGEGVAVDPQGQVYVVSKVQGGNALFAQLPSSGWGATDPVTIDSESSVRLGLHTHHHDPLAADISPDGRALLIKAKEHVYYYHFGSNMDYIKELASMTPKSVNTYIRSDEGQAIAWAADGTGFFVLPEGRLPTIDFYSVTGSAGSIVG